MSVSTNQSTATCSIMASQATGEVMMAVGDMNINETISMEMVMRCGILRLYPSSVERFLFHIIYFQIGRKDPNFYSFLN